jgi:aryl-alcohol dehydrogenase-like predicted oxidoreductase
MVEADKPGLRSVPKGAFDLAPSCLGFGCASLGSRIGADKGLRALSEAHERGVVWYDVAPAYGAGEAEAILSQFVRGRRDKVLLTTKVGIAPPARLGAIKLAYALGRPLIGAAAGLRRTFRKMSATRNVHVPLSPDLIERSIADSLRRLGVDHVDVYALHDPDPADVLRDDVIAALERTRARGQARQIAVAGKLEAVRAAREIGGPYTVLQMSVADLSAGHEAFSTGAQGIVAHSVFGVDGLKRRVEIALTGDAAYRARLAGAGYDADPARAAADLLMDCAFALNQQGVVLASMFDARHLEANLARAARPLSPRAPALLREILSGEPGQS